MYLIPYPKRCHQQEGYFYLNSKTPIVLGHTCTLEDLETAKILQQEIQNIIGLQLEISKSFITKEPIQGIYLIRGEGKKEAYKLCIDQKAICIEASIGTGIFYGVQTLRQLIRQYGAALPQVEIEDEPHFEHRGFYHDVTRGKVPTLDTLKELVDRAAFYKINQLQLYIEHTFAFKGMSEVWQGKDPLTAEEILYLDAYCQARHIELVPSIATFGHLYEALRSSSFCHLCEVEENEGIAYSFVDRMLHHTLDVTNTESIKLVEKMLTEFIPLFSSDKFNICCDETFDLGKGKSKAKGEKVGVGRLYTDFLNKVIGVVKGYGKQVMFWGDIILHHPELISEIPEDVVCLTWDYAAEVKEESIKTIAEAGRKQYVCPGVSGWNRLMNLMDEGFRNIRGMAEYGVKYGAIGLLNTDWGDYGHINLLGSSIPGMAYGGAVSWNPTSGDNLDEMYKALSQIEYGDDSMQLVGLLNKLAKAEGLGWGELIRWREAYPNLEEAEKIISDVDAIELIEGYQAAVQIEHELVNLMRQVKHHRVDMQEFILSARGIQLMNAYFLTVLHFQMNRKEAKLVEMPKDLGERLEIWFYDYSQAWRKRNKESELYRIREVISSLCKELRNY